MSSTSRLSARRAGLGSAGFTLMELLISMAILAFISIAIYQATTETFRLRDVLSQEGDFYNSIRLSMDIVNRDVSALYSPTMMLQTKKKAATTAQPPANAFGTGPANPGNSNNADNDQQELEAGELAQATPFWGPAIDKTGLRGSRFNGSSTKMTFISSSHNRVYRDSPESEFAKITYELQDDPNASAEQKDTRRLVKIESPNAFDLDAEGDRDKFHRLFPLLHGVKKLAFRYWKKNTDGSGGGKWETSWDTERSDFKGIYPDMIEVSIEVVGPSRLSHEGVYRFRPEVPFRGLSAIF